MNPQDADMLLLQDRSGSSFIEATCLPSTLFYSSTIKVMNQNQKNSRHSKKQAFFSMLNL